MMLKYSFNQPELAKAVDEAVRRSIDNGVTTPDIGGKSKTSEVGDEIAKQLTEILRKA